MSTDPGGRPTKLTEEVADLICFLIRKGVPDKHAALAAGIHPSTLIAWKHRGEAETHEPIDPDQHTKKTLQAIAADRGADIGGRTTKRQIADAINDHRSLFSKFYESLRASESIFMSEAVVAIQQYGWESKDWRAAAFLLERRFPEIFGRSREDGEFETTGGSRDDAERMLGQAEAIEIKMLEAG